MTRRRWGRYHTASWFDADDDASVTDADATTNEGGILPFLIPLGLLAAKAAAAGAISAGVGYGVKKALDRRGRR